MGNGCVIDSTPIAVDFWRPTKAPQVYLYFLTHLHADHTDGLTSSWRFPIFTSTTNALLLTKMFKLPRHVIREMEIGESHIIPLDNEQKNTMTVTAFDANHVPGAVIFLFQGYFGNILYCGDMRWSPHMLLNDTTTPLTDVIQSRQLDVLYLDNTYSAPYCQHPSRKEATQQIIKIIEAYPDNEIKIGINKIGQEALLENIAKRFGEKILVNEKRYEELRLLRRLDVFTVDPTQSRIHTVNKKQITVAAHKKWNEKHPTITIIPTALFVGWKNAPYSSQASNGIYVIPYSDHSSYPELMDMVSKLAPHRIIPIVKSWSKGGWWNDPCAPDQSIKADMTLYSHLLSLPPPDPVVIPKEVIDKMNSRCPGELLTKRRSNCYQKVLFPKVRSEEALGMTRAPSAMMAESSKPINISFRIIDSSRSDSNIPDQQISKTQSRSHCNISQHHLIPKSPSRPDCNIPDQQISKTPSRSDCNIPNQQISKTQSRSDCNIPQHHLIPKSPSRPDSNIPDQQILPKSPSRPDCNISLQQHIDSEESLSLLQESPGVSRDNSSAPSQATKGDLKGIVLETVRNEGENSQIPTHVSDGSHVRLDQGRVLESEVNTNHMSETGARVDTFARVSDLDNQLKVSESSETATLTHTSDSGNTQAVNTQAMDMSDTGNTQAAVLNTTAMDMSDSGNTQAVNTQAMDMSDSQSHLLHTAAAHTSSDSNKDTGKISESDDEPTKEMKRERKRKNDSKQDEFQQHSSLKRKHKQHKVTEGRRMYLDQKAEFRKLIAGNINLVNKKIGEYLACQLENINSERKMNVDKEMKCIERDTKMIYKAISCLDFLMDALKTHS